MARVQNPNHPVTGLQFAPQTGSNTSYPSSWYNLTDRLVSYSVKKGKQRELGLAEAGVGSFVLRDKDEALNPSNASSPYNTGGNTLKLYRPLRFWQMPSTAGSWAGNLLNANNDVWLTVRGNAGSYADSASFEGGTVGGWTVPVGSSTTAANSAVRAHDGSKSMVLTWPTQTGGGSGAGASVTLPGVPYRVGDSYTISVWIWINAGPAVVLYSNGWAVTSSSTTGAWQRVVLTVTAGDGDNDIWLWPAGSSTSGQQVWVDSVQVEYAGSASAFTTSGPTIYPVYTGFIERYPKSWQHMGIEGYCQISCTDVLGMIPRVQLNSALSQEIKLDNPTYWWKFDDGVTGGVFNQSGTSQDPQIQSWSGWSTSSGNSASAFSANTDRNGPGADAPGYLATNPAWISPNAYPALPDLAAAWVISWAGTNLVGGTAAGFSVEFFFMPLGAGWTQRIFTMGSTTNNHNDEYDWGLDSTGHLTYKYYNGSGTVLETLTSATVPTAGVWHHMAMTTSSSGGTITTKVYLDGSLVGTQTRAAATVPQRKNMLIGTGWNGTRPAVTNPDTGYEPYYGYLSNLAVYNAAALSVTRIGVHSTCASTGYEGDYTGQRIKRILAYAGWAGYTNIPDVTGVQQGAIRGLQDAYVADAVKVASDTDQGLLYAAPSGMLQYLPQATIAASTPTVTFGEDVAGGEIPYREGVVEELEPSQIYNYVTVSPKDLPKNDLYLMPVYKFDNTSISDYGTRTLSLTIQPRSGSTGLTQLQNMATFLLAQKKDPRPMVTGVQIPVSGRPVLWAAALALTVGQCVTWKRRTSAGVVVSINGYIQTINWTENAKSGAICTVDIEPIQV